MKTGLLLLITLLNTLTFPLLGQEISISENLKVVKLSEHTYLHTGNDNNGIVYANDGEAVIVSTPELEEETQKLIDWVRDSLNLKIVGYIIDRWHPDAMGGIDAVHKSGITTYANELTREMAREKGLTVPLVGFSPLVELHVGGNMVIGHYLGAAHTEDGIVVWIPEEKILFGGNEVRSLGGWFGNIGDANLKEWSNTVKKVKECYGDAEIVIPGHGKYGGAELLDYTIKLYRQDGVLKEDNQVVPPVFNGSDFMIEAAMSDSIAGEKRYLKDATVFVNHSKKYLRITSPGIMYTTGEKMLSSDSGRLQIYRKEGNELIVDLQYNQLFVNLRDDEVEWTIIIKEVIR